MDHPHFKCIQESKFDTKLSKKQPKILPKILQKKPAYISLVRSTMKYGAIVCDPNKTNNINKLGYSEEQNNSSQGFTNLEKKDQLPKYLPYWN